MAVDADEVAEHVVIGFPVEVSDYEKGFSLFAFDYFSTAFLGSAIFAFILIMCNQ